MKKYTVPKIEVMTFDMESILTMSGVSDKMQQWADENAGNNATVGVLDYRKLNAVF